MSYCCNHKLNIALAVLQSIFIFIFIFIDNPISERAFRYLTCLPKLEQLDVSGTGMKVLQKYSNEHSLVLWLIFNCQYLQLGPGLKRCIWDLLGLIHSEKPLDTFDHSKCKTEGWAEQVRDFRRNTSSRFLSYLFICPSLTLSYFQVVNQWETNGTQMPMPKKIEESRTSALRFCMLPY